MNATVTAADLNAAKDIFNAACIACSQDDSTANRDVAQAAWAKLASLAYDAQFVPGGAYRICGQCGSYLPHDGQSCGCFDNGGQ
jgi:hypothetical protein